MLKFHLKLAFKNFKSNRLVFGGSIATIFLATLCISLLFSYTQNELSMDDFHKRKNDIYLITFQESKGSNPEVWEASRFFNFNYKDYPEIENLTAFKKYKEGEIKFTYDERSYSPAGIIADSVFFEVFDFKLTAGNKATVLHDPDAIVISQNFAKKIFGDKNPIGKPITVTTRIQKVYTVKGILAPIASNSSLEFDYIIPDHSGEFNRMGGNFILVKNNFNKADFSKKLKKIVQENKQFSEGKASIFPLSKVYFEGTNINSRGIFTKFGDKNNINILYTIIAVIFIISLLNFTNLQIININSSIKNIGINKISGAGSKQIVLQKLIEIFLLILLSSVAISLSFKVVLPYFNQITQINLAPEWWQIFLLIVSILVLLVAGAMIYPFILYSTIPITTSLKKQASSNTRLTGRKVLVISQFALSFIMLIASVVVVKQLGLLLNKDLGFNSKNIICTQLFHEPQMINGSREELMKQYQAYLDNFQFEKNELKSQSSVRNFSIGDSPIQPFDMSWKLKDGKNDYSTEKSLIVSPEFAKLFGLQILEGRFFDRKMDKERSNKLVINEAAKRYLGISDINTKQILNKSWGEYEIIGVVKDFNFQHLSVKPQPLFLLFFEDMEDQFMIQFEDGATQAGLQFAKKLFEKNNPGEAFKYTFLSDDIQDLYQKEKRLSKIYILFTLIAYFISFIGLFAISLYDTKRRTKEIGIRKVNGARISEVLVMLNKDFLKWIVSAFVIATPVAYYTMHKWLENFAYKTELSWWIFVLAGLLALAIALLTVSFQSWKAATSNPVEALRNE